ncbi:tannase/feruloyl esterase family alpha/beta hydrolase [Lentzea guizhouensis]|uniref:tannase/feruloyl esterase family alpha/beta hydrolase n=1 Tax=Lentzea guizhouensis TaxID=1586287 RepID=UPI00202A12CE|nr:tannase/feruloyl esterase family alpha/beta hydrolase [Lentzea guizhouensis]
MQSFLLKQPGYDTSKLTYQQFRDLFRQSVREYDSVIGTSDADLSAFRRSGGKLLTFVGTSDQLIPPGGTLKYREQVERTTAHVNDFYRLFLAPGVDHCAGGGGAAPTNQLGALVDWVERGKAPATLAAAAPDGSTRNLGAYPQVSRYVHGDPKVASSYRCTR